MHAAHQLVRFNEEGKTRRDSQGERRSVSFFSVSAVASYWPIPVSGDKLVRYGMATPDLIRPDVHK